ncbi:IS66 family insertion sequence element accessory protein TnpB [Caballeronia sp. EK]|uniref:IS66 family insertion sequence element accessory protein TnpB n=1 Tax=Caballeronia sp. EK TaxID=2767469 RepID=UPI0016555360|nr:IS66 family insertion sequence element accessory protein TnpB [Caballeronia sp. EK]MBC8641961.1 IS66 family insertion sequence element accessory protein TnpB [Caballeronia sp. EK]
MLIATDLRACICREAVDMRKSIDALLHLVEPLLEQKPASGNLFVFVGRDRTKVKCLYWDRTGFALWYKRLEHVALGAGKTRFHARRAQCMVGRYRDSGARASPRRRGDARHLSA